jgi:hypothetical protein
MSSDHWTFHHRPRRTGCRSRATPSVGFGIGVLLQGQNGGVRKQYNFWPGETGLDAWDVDRLVLLSKDLPVREIALDSIGEIDTNYWFDYGSVDPTVRRVVEHIRLVQDADLSYPIILGSDGRVMDGMHRIARALLNGDATIRAVQFEVQPEPDFRNCSPGDLPY